MSNKDDNDFTLKPSIPQLFYDIIARIVPGSVIIGVLAVAAAGPEKSARFVGEWLNRPGDSYPSIIVLVIFGFVASYTLAIILFGLGNLTSKLLPKRLSPASSDEEFPMKYDFVKSRDPIAGSRITKWTAERHMAGILMLGLILSMLINFVKMPGSPDGSRSIFTLVLAFGIAGSLGAFYYFIKRQNDGIQNYCDLLGYEDWKAKCDLARAKSVNTAASAEAENGKREASPAATITS